MYIATELCHQLNDAQVDTIIVFESVLPTLDTFSVNTVPQLLVALAILSYLSRGKMISYARQT